MVNRIVSIKIVKNTTWTALIPLCLLISSCSYNDLNHSAKPELNDKADHLITAPLPDNYKSPPANPPPGKEIRKYALDSPEEAPSNFGDIRMRDDEIFHTLSADRLEYRNYQGEEIFLWDASGWLGNNYHKLYLESEGEHIYERRTESADLELLYGRTISSFWDFRLGARYDIRPTPKRFFAVLGLKGLAPQWFEVESNIYLSEEGDVTGDLELEYDLLLSQRLILQPRAEFQVSAQDAKEYGTAAGLNKLELGARVRYELSRKFAPYIGLSWSRLVGETANMAEREGEEESKLFFLAGIKLWI